MAKPKQIVGKCRLLSIPPEVRNNIYEKVFDSTDIIRPNVHFLFQIASQYERYGDRFTVIPPATKLALALTCRQIHNEALRFYYGRNTFSFSDTYDLYRYLYMIGEERRQCIKSIEIFWQGERRREAAELIGECINLRRLYIGVGCDTTQYTKHPQEDLWLARGVGQLKKIRGLPDLDLRVREVNHWGRWCKWPVFELSIVEVHQHMFRIWPPKFDPRHIAEFAKGLKEAMAKAGEKAGEDIFEVVGSGTLGPVQRNKYESKSRVLRTRKVDTKTSRGRRTRKVSTRKAGKKGEILRRARGT